MFVTVIALKYALLVRRTSLSVLQYPVRSKWNGFKTTTHVRNMFIISRFFRITMHVHLAKVFSTQALFTLPLKLIKYGINMVLYSL